MKKRKTPMDPIQNFLLNFLLVIVVLWVLFGFMLGAVTAPNSDMSPNIKARDLLLYYRLAGSFRAQDVVILKKNGTTYIGRIVAAGGDTIEINDSEQPVINGNVVSEPDIHSPTPRFEGFVDYPVKLSDDEVFVLADSRGGAEDSRYYGTVKLGEIKGKVVTVIRRNYL